MPRRDSRNVVEHWGKSATVRMGPCEGGCKTLFPATDRRVDGVAGVQLTCRRCFHSAWVRDCPVAETPTARGIANAKAEPEEP